MKFKIGFHDRKMVIPVKNGIVIGVGNLSLFDNSLFTIKVLVTPPFDKNEF